MSILAFKVVLYTSSDGREECLRHREIEVDGELNIYSFIACLTRYNVQVLEKKSNEKGSHATARVTHPTTNAPI